MLKLAAIVSAVALLAAAPAMPHVDIPPPDFQRAPDAPAVVIYGHPAAVDAVCREGTGLVGGTIFACTFPARRAQIMPNPCLFPDEFYARLQCHENGHLPRADGTHWRH